MFSKHYLRPTVVQTYSYFYNTDKATVFKHQPQFLASLSKASCSTVPPPSSTSSTTTPFISALSGPRPTSIIDDITVVNGLPHITVPLPSRHEKCVFALKPISNNVGDFLAMLCAEDRGIDRAVIKNKDGVRIASKTSIQTLFDQEFCLQINDNEFNVKPPAIESLSKEELQKISDVKLLVSQLYEALNIEEFQLSREQELASELELLKKELEPLEAQRSEILRHADERTSTITWVGLGLMSVQFGILARLTWWEYSWDIMEPVTYFVTYGTAIACYAYFVMTRQEFLYQEAKDRQSLVTFHKKASKHRWDVDRYNALREGIGSIEADLRRIRDPLGVHVPGKVQEKKVSAGLLGIPLVSMCQEKFKRRRYLLDY